MTKKGTRTPEEDLARSQCRHLVHEEGAYVKKLNPRQVYVGECDLWPEGIVTDFRGWRDLFLRLERCRAEPSLVRNGHYRVDTSDIAA